MRSSSTRETVALAVLMRRYLGGDQRAFAELYRQLLPRIRRQLSRLVEEGQATEDLAQLTLLRAHGRRDRFRFEGVGVPRDPDRAVIAWYLAIARRVATDHLRRTGRAETATGGDASAGAAADSAEELLIRRERDAARARALQHAVTRLSPTQREVVVMHTLGGMTAAEVAARLRLRSGTVRVRVHRAHRSLERLVSRKLARASHKSGRTPA